MSDENQPLEFSAFDMMPDWATGQSKPSPEPRSERPPRTDRGEGGSGPRRSEDQGHRGFRDRGDRGEKGRGGDDRGRGGFRGRGDSREGGQGDRPDRRGPGGRRDDSRRGGPRDRRNDDGRRGRDREEAPRETPPPEGVSVSFEPTPAALTGLARHLRESLRTFPLAELAKVVLASRDRYQARFASVPDGPAFYQCLDDRSVWLSREEAVAHFLGNALIETYYEIREVEIEPPKGNFSSVAVCGLSGTILGPSSHHDYQRKLRMLHAERFAHMPLERYLTRVRNESSEEVLEKWRASVSRRTEYLPKGSVFAVAEDTVPQITSDEAEANEPAVEAVAEGETTEESAEGIGETAPDDAVNVPEPEAAAEEEAGAEDSPADAEATEGEPSNEIEDSESGEETDPAPAPEAEADPAFPSMKSWDELVEHFKAHYAEEAIIERRDAVVPGNIHGSLLSRGLLTLIKSEGERLRRGFPLAMVQALCRGLEGENLRFFKRGKKALHVSAVRPQALDPEATLTDQVQRIVDHLAAHPRCRVVDLLDGIVEEFTRPTKDAPHEAIELPEAAKSVLKDLRWLTAEGFVLEFADTSLVIAKQTPPAPGSAAAKGDKGVEGPAKAVASGKGGNATKASAEVAPEKGERRKKGPKQPAAPVAAAAPGSEKRPDEMPLDPLVALDRDDAACTDLDELPVSTDPVGEGEAV